MRKVGLLLISFLMLAGVAWGQVSANPTLSTIPGGPGVPYTGATSDLALGTHSITMTGSLGATGSRLTYGWFTDLTVTNVITGSVSGNAATVTNGVYTTGAGTVFQSALVQQPYTSATPWQVTPAVGTTGARIIVVCASVDHALTIMAHSGTPVNGQILEFWFQSDTSAHALDFTTATTYRNLSAVMPTTTVISKWTKVGFRWNAYATTPIWDCDAAGQQP